MIMIIVNDIHEENDNYHIDNNNNDDDDDDDDNNDDNGDDGDDDDDDVDPTISKTYKLTGLQPTLMYMWQFYRKKEVATADLQTSKLRNNSVQWSSLILRSNIVSQALHAVTNPHLHVRIFGLAILSKH